MVWMRWSFLVIPAKCRETNQVDASLLAIWCMLQTMIACVEAGEAAPRPASRSHTTGSTTSSPSGMRSPAFTSACCSRTTDAGCTSATPWPGWGTRWRRGSRRWAVLCPAALYCAGQVGQLLEAEADCAEARLRATLETLQQGCAAFNQATGYH